MIDRLTASYPEVFLFVITCAVMIIGLSRQHGVRVLCAWLGGVGLLGSIVLTLATTQPGTSTHYLPNLPMYGKVLAAGVGFLLLLLISGTPDRAYELQLERGAKFDPLRSSRAEFYSFFLFSITGLMLCAGADDLIILFLALELTSLPTYVMVVLSTARNKSMESGVKYFFLGAMGAAVFLFGFALMYGATGTTKLNDIAQILSTQVATGGLSGIAIAGLLLAIIGVSFKIAAVPMHFYTPDVYQGASATVSAFLAFVPKAAGFFSLMLLVGTIGWGVGETNGTLPRPFYEVLAIMAVLTMTIGNVLAILQSSVKRILAYSSIAHSGYMLVGLVAGPGKDGEFSSSGLAAILFYLLSYGVMNLGAFAVLSCLERPSADGGDEIDHIDDIKGLCHTRPVLGWMMVISSVGLLGLPPLLGFFAKLPLFTAGISAGETTLVVMLGINSAIAAYYYLRLASAALLETPDPARVAQVRPVPFGWFGMFRTSAAVLSGVGIVVLAAVPLTRQAQFGAEFRRPLGKTSPPAVIESKPAAVKAAPDATPIIMHGQAIR
jgi:NADH-quinone oxidoreductase subunit N